MKIMLRDLLNIADEKLYQVNVLEHKVENNIFLRGIKDVEGDISFYYDSLDKLRINYEIKGYMVCPDSITLEDVDVFFHLCDDTEVTNDENEEGFFLNRDMSIEEMVLHIVLPEVPIKVEKNNETMYYSGDGWTICSEEEYNNSAKEKIDPRLEKILEYKEEK